MRRADHDDVRRKASEYGPSKHPADPGRGFTVCFRTTSSAHQIRELAQAIADAEQRGREAERAAAADELRQYELLVEALQFVPAGTVIDFADRDDFIEEVRDMGWRPRRECKGHKFIDSDECIYCHWEPGDEEQGIDPSKQGAADE